MNRKLTRPSRELEALFDERDHLSVRLSLASDCGDSALAAIRAELRELETRIEGLQRAPGSDALHRSD